MDEGGSALSAGNGTRGHKTFPLPRSPFWPGVPRAFCEGGQVVLRQFIFTPSCKLPHSPPSRLRCLPWAREALNSYLCFFPSLLPTNFSFPPPSMLFFVVPALSMICPCRLTNPLGKLDKDISDGIENLNFILLKEEFLFFFNEQLTCLESSARHYCSALGF